MIQPTLFFSLYPNEVSLNNDEGADNDDEVIYDCAPNTTQSGEVMPTSEDSTTPNEDPGEVGDTPGEIDTINKETEETNVTPGEHEMDDDEIASTSKDIFNSIISDDNSEDISEDHNLNPTSDEEVEGLYDQFEVEDDENYVFERIMDHHFDKGILHLNVKYVDNDQDHIMCVPFGILKKDVPLELARYIKDKVVESSRRGYYSLWAKKIITNYSRSIKILH